jgi:hypothetical protein
VDLAKRVADLYRGSAKRCIIGGNVRAGIFEFTLQLTGLLVAAMNLGLSRSVTSSVVTVALTLLHGETNRANPGALTFMARLGTEAGS